MQYDENLRKSLIGLGSERLADVLVDMASRNEEAEDILKRITSSPTENIKRFKTKLAGLKRSNRFVDWRGSAEFAQELEGILDDLRAGVEDPRLGVELVADFFECDSAVFERCDDSSGNVGDVFRFTARDLFADYASACADKARILELVEALYADDDYGVRDVLVRAASQYLTEASLRDMADRFWARAEKEKENSYKVRRWTRGVESLARQLKDAPLFEKACLTAWPELSSKRCLEIAEVWLEAGDAETSLSWVRRASEHGGSSDFEQDELLLAVYQKLGDREKLAETAWRMFHEYRCEDSLDTLLDAIGKENRERVIGEEAGLILQSGEFSDSDAEFLIMTGRIDDAEAYLLRHAGQLNGDFYSSLLSLAESMEKHGRRLAASVIYRALLDSILHRAVSKYYHHGVRYLKKLDSLAQEITDWQGFIPHREYEAGIREAHSRKSSFWSLYGG